MGSRKGDVRLGSKELFVYYHKGVNGGGGIQVGGCTNKRILSRKTGIAYNTLMWVFTRKSMCYYDNENTVIMKLFVSSIEKGKQCISRKGRGGMERFRERYLMKKRGDY